jgi:ATP-binding cassette subfamily C protein EexD
LDDQGEKELVNALNRVKESGCTVVVITHRTMVLQCVDKILVMKEGAAVAFGPRDEVLASLTNPAKPPQLAAD